MLYIYIYINQIVTSRIHIFQLHMEHTTYSRIDYILGHKTRLNKCKKIEMISNFFSDHNTMKLESTSRKKLQKAKA